MANLTHLRLVVDSEVFHLSSGKEGEAEARRLAQAGFAKGARYIDLYRAPIGTTQWTLVRHFEQMKPSAYFRAAARSIQKTGAVESFDLPGQAHAELLMDSIFMYPRGTREIRQLCADLAPQDERRIEVRGVFRLTVSVAKEGANRLEFRLHPYSPKIGELTQFFLVAGNKKPGTVATTPHYLRVGRRRERSLMR